MERFGWSETKISKLNAPKSKIPLFSLLYSNAAVCLDSQTEADTHLRWVYEQLLDGAMDGGSDETPDLALAVAANQILGQEGSLDDDDDNDGDEKGDYRRWLWSRW